MARERDESKRTAILEEATRLFAERGFHATSVSDIVKGIDLPVGSVYTYFENKDAIIKAAIEEGWARLPRRAVGRLRGRALGPRARLDIIINRFLPALLQKTELISLILLGRRALHRPERQAGTPGRADRRRAPGPGRRAGRAHTALSPAQARHRPRRVLPGEPGHHSAVPAGRAAPSRVGRAGLHPVDRERVGMESGRTGLDGFPEARPPPLPAAAVRAAVPWTRRAVRRACQERGARRGARPARRAA